MWYVLNTWLFCDANDLILGSYIQRHVWSLHIIPYCYKYKISFGQTLSQVGLFLPKPLFSHEQLYVALSRVKSMRVLKVLCLDRDGNYCNSTANVVYKEVLCRIWIGNIVLYTQHVILDKPDYLVFVIFLSHCMFLLCFVIFNICLRPLIIVYIIMKRTRPSGGLWS